MRKDSIIQVTCSVSGLHVGNFNFEIRMIEQRQFLISHYSSYGNTSRYAEVNIKI